MLHIYSYFPTSYPKTSIAYSCSASCFLIWLYMGDDTILVHKKLTLFSLPFPLSLLFKKKNLGLHFVEISFIPHRLSPCSNPQDRVKRI